MSVKPTSAKNHKYRNRRHRIALAYLRVLGPFVGWTLTGAAAVLEAVVR